MFLRLIFSKARFNNYYLKNVKNNNILDKESVLKDKINFSILEEGISLIDLVATE